MRKLSVLLFCLVFFGALLPVAAHADPAEDAYQRAQGATKKGDHETAFREYLRAAELGHLGAQIHLALSYAASPSPEDFLEARKWFRKGAEQGASSPQLALADMYREGDLDGRHRDYREAIRWYQKAATSQNPRHRGEACHALAEMHEQGLGVPKNPGQALKWYRQAASLGEAESKYRLGYLYETGQGVGRDYRQAAQWYREASAARVAVARFRLGLLYERGLGVSASRAEATNWYRRAAEGGYGPCQYALGQKYEQGAGVPKDLVKAHLWYHLATRGLGDQALWDKAKAARARVAAKLTPQQLARAQKLGKEWRPQ
ncbi:MAG: sel1 repeat family protein [Deltaproteobacteria bacterium]|nr:sel1 repeat family protein [Deltaproteobacteria bacterium]